MSSLQYLLDTLPTWLFPDLGEVSRCGVLTRYEKIPFTKSFGTVITERAIDMFIFVILFFLNIFAQRALLYGYIEKTCL